MEPILLYGAEIWLSDFNININKCDNLPFEKIQHLVFKDILGVHSKASNLAVKHELGELPLCLKGFSLMFNYFLRLNSDKQQNGIKTEILIAAIQEDTTLKNNTLSESWQKQLHTLNRKLNLTTLTISKTAFKDTLTQSYKNNVATELQNIRLNNSGKLVFYSQIKGKYEMQDYLKFPIKKSVRASLTKLRISAHSLEIETGRYHKPPKPKENRYCNYCKNIVEDECHFIYSCPLYNTLRMRFDPTLCNLGADKESNCAKLLKSR